MVDAVRSSVESRRLMDVVGLRGMLRRFAASPECDEIEVAGLEGIVSYEPEELTVTVRAGTSVMEISEALAAAGQECPLDGPGSTVGGRIASGISGVRRLGLGHIREWLLGGRIVTGEGAAVRFGAPIVKNVSGYDLPRLLCGSWGTLGVLTELTLRVRPQPHFQGWFFGEHDPAVFRRIASPAAAVRTRKGTFILLEGHPEDCLEQARRFELSESEAPEFPEDVRISVPSARMEQMLSEIEGPFAAELGVGTIHATLPHGGSSPIVERARALGGRALVFDGKAPQSELFRVSERVAGLTARVKQAFDPFGLFAPWRLQS